MAPSVPTCHHSNYRPRTDLWRIVPSNQRRTRVALRLIKSRRNHSRVGQDGQQLKLRVDRGGQQCRTPNGGAVSGCRTRNWPGRSKRWNSTPRRSTVTVLRNWRGGQRFVKPSSTLFPRPIGWSPAALRRAAVTRQSALGPSASYVLALKMALLRDGPDYFQSPWSKMKAANAHARPRPKSSRAQTHDGEGGGNCPAFNAVAGDTHDRGKKASHGGMDGTPPTPLLPSAVATHPTRWQTPSRNVRSHLRPRAAGVTRILLVTGGAVAQAAITLVPKDPGMVSV
ncbi:hypothetical protein Nepgr_021262 [Nepenthes gracilis]|uniref:Uncharacterized protein n=1 Tax=Nepenthes gracilis TaxID=150966 RepID=A0AAD3SYR7_NEPGR|nr:hypothetical protein Nepgr_021262 [Nepenthes gracilis]